MSKCELLLTPQDANVRGITNDQRQDSISYECGNPATVLGQFKDQDKPQMICEQCHSECADFPEEVER